MKIRVLPVDIASRIAAGEVIEGPAAVIKELVENSIDAFSTMINVTLLQGGKTRIVVEDNGQGMEKEDMKVSLQRHATSKIEKLEDLENINTLGFRGEALASISAVSRLDMRSRTADMEKGSLLQAEAGSVLSIRDVNWTHGTRIQVDDLFYNLPARRKFLKSTVAEFRRISQLIRAFCLSYPEIDFQLIHDGKITLSSRGKTTRRDILELLWSHEPEILVNHHKAGTVSIDCWTQKQPGKKKLMVQSFVNKRIIQDSMIKAALHSALGEISANVALFITIPSDHVDVNIHPAKTEVRFRYSREIFDAVREAASELLGKNSVNIVPFPLDQDCSAKELFSGSRTGERSCLNRTADTPLFSRVAQSFPGSKMENGEVYATGYVENDTHASYSDGEVTFFGQLAIGYLLFESAGSLFLMDHHASHERVTFEKIRNRSGTGRSAVPLAIRLEIPQQFRDDVMEYMEALEKSGFGFDITNEGLFLKSIPQCLGELTENPFEYLSSLIMTWNEGSSPIVDGAVWFKWTTMACKASVKLTTRLTSTEALALWRDLMACDNPYACPHGRPTLLEISEGNLLHYFGR